MIHQCFVINEVLLKCDIPVYWNALNRNITIEQVKWKLMEINTRFSKADMCKFAVSPCSYVENISLIPVI